MATEIRGWIVIPYAGEPKSRLAATVASAKATDWGDRVHVQEDTERSLPKTINRAVSLVREVGATHICWLSTGDTLHRDRFSPVYPPCEDGRGQCCLVRIRSRGVTIPDTYTDWRRALYKDNQFCGSGMVVPMPVWDSVGGFDETLTYCSDWDFAMRVGHSFGWDCMPRVMAVANEYPDGLTRAADPVIRARDRARVARLGRRLQKS